MIDFNFRLFLENCLASALLDEDKTELSEGCVKDLAMIQQCTIHEEASVNNFLASITLVDG